MVLCELFARMITQWKEHMYCTVKFTQQKISNDYAEVTPMMGMLLISTHIIDHFRKLQWFRKWDNRLDINADHETSYTTEY